MAKKDNVPELTAEVRTAPRRSQDLTEVMYLNLQTPVTVKNGGPYCLILPADNNYLDEVRQYVGVEDLNDARIIAIGFFQP